MKPHHSSPLFVVATLGAAVVVSACGSEDTPSIDAATPDGAANDAGMPDAAGCPPQTGLGTSHQGNIAADETWTAATGPHLIEFNLQIVSGTLTIEPCVVVRVKQGYTITVGSGNPAAPAAGLVARATADRPILFTAAVAGAPWGMLAVNASAQVDLEHVTLSGGGDHASAQDLGGTLKIRGPGGTKPHRNTRVKHVRIEGSAGYGVNVQTAGGFTADSTGLTIVDAGRVPSGANFDTNFPIYVTPPSVQTLPPGTYTGNARDQILVGAEVSLDGDETFRDLGIPYRIKTRLALLPVKSAAEGGLATLTLDAGVKMLLLKQPGNLWGISLGASNGATPANIWPVKLLAMGTAARPIVITSAADQPTAGDWAGIHWAGGPATGNVMSHVRIEYAGGDQGTGNFGCGPPDNDAALIITNWRPEVSFLSDVTISDSAGGGIVSGWVSDAAGPDLKAGNTFTRIANGCAVSRWQNATPPACPGTPPLCL